MESVQTLADRLLTDLGAPHTPDMQAAAQAWIVHENGINNNILGVTSNGKLNSYSSPIEGIDAAAALLKSPDMSWAGYDSIVAQAQQGNAVGFLQAISRSKWNGPGGAYRDKPWVLISTFKSILSGSYGGTKLNSPGSDFGGGTSGGGGGSAGGSLTGTGLSGFNFGVTFPEGQPLNSDMVNQILKALEKQKVFSNEPTGIGEGFVRDILNRHIGEPWNKELQDKLQKEMLGTATSVNPLSGINLDVQSAVIFLAIVLVGIVFIGGGAIISLRKNV